MNKTQKIGSYVVVGAVVVVGVLYATGVIRTPESADAMFQKMAQAESKVTSAEVSVALTADMTLSGSGSADQSFHVAGNFDGAVNKTSGGPSEDMHIAVTESSPTSSEVSVEGNLRFVDKVLYIEATKLPPLPIDAGALTNKWISFDLLALAKQSGDPMLASQLEASLGSKSASMPAQFYIDSIDLAKKDGLVKSVTPAGGEKISGVATNAYAFTFDMTKTAQFLPDYIALYNTYLVKNGGTAISVPTLTDAQKASLSQISIPNFKVWIGASDYLPYKVAGTFAISNASVTATSGVGMSGTISFTETVKAYNTNPTITKPDGSVPFEQFLKSMFGGAVPSAK